MQMKKRFFAPFSKKISTNDESCRWIKSDMFRVSGAKLWGGKVKTRWKVGKMAKMVNRCRLLCSFYREPVRLILWSRVGQGGREAFQELRLLLFGLLHARRPWPVSVHVGKVPMRPGSGRMSR